MLPRNGVRVRAAFEQFAGERHELLPGDAFENAVHVKPALS
jgi:hypothetical protein